MIVCCQNERRRQNHKILKKEKDKKIYDMCDDRYVTVGFENSGTSRACLMFVTPSTRSILCPIDYHII